MTKQVIWTEAVLEEFISKANLTELEEKVMRTRVLEWPRSKQCTELHISMSTLDRVIKRLKTKYDAVQKYSDTLPPRRESAKELYLDTH